MGDLILSDDGIPSPKKIRLADSELDLDKSAEAIPSNSIRKTTMNPLLMDEILDHVMSFLTVTELKNGRHVCRLWDSRSSALIKNRWTQIKVLNLKNEKNFANFEEVVIESKDGRVLGGRIHIDLGQFMDSSFFGRFEPKDLQIVMTSKAPQYALHEFLDKLAFKSDNMEKLSLKFYSKVSPAPFEETVDEALPLPVSFPHLKSLNFEAKSFQFFEEIVKRSPHLSSVQVTKAPMDIELNKLLENSSIGTLSELKVSFQNRNKMVEMNFYKDLINLQKRGLVLKSLELGLDFPIPYSQNDVDSEIKLFHEFCYNQAEKLENIEIIFGSVFSVKLCLLDLPVFKNLKKLSLGNEGLMMKFPQFDLEKFPQLVEFQMNHTGSWDEDFEEVAQIFKNTAQKVHTFQIKTDTMYIDYKQLEKFFPNVQNLTIQRLEEVSQFPWVKTLQSLSVENFDKLWLEEVRVKDIKMDTYKALTRLEISQENGPNAAETSVNTEFFLFSLNVIKSLKLRNFTIPRKTLSLLKVKFGPHLDYIPRKIFGSATNNKFC